MNKMKLTFHTKKREHLKKAKAEEEWKLLQFSLGVYEFKSSKCLQIIPDTIWKVLTLKNTFALIQPVSSVMNLAPFLLTQLAAEAVYQCFQLD